MIFIKSSANAQDPSFSQFFSSPLNVNPALTANINADWRTISNIRNQWLGPASPYVTGTISFDTKLFQRNIANVPDRDSYFGIGTMLMYDYAMSRTVKSTYASLDLSYNIKLAENEGSRHSLGAGFGGIYGNRRISFDRLNFNEQFTGFGFNTNLPTGEIALSNMKPYISSSAGLTYSYQSKKSNLDVGVAGYHLNRPKQTFLEDKNQYIPMRRVAHANFETFLNDRLVLNANAIFQYQLEANYFSGGAALGYDLGGAEKVVVNGGVWYWSKNAVIPYFGFSYQSFQVGVSYDLTTSKLAQAERRPNTWELSLILRGSKTPSKVIPCPWK
jgi:type IX secretion system PorP/SprF family membrane protein